jgi:hypothetical protein
MNPGQPVNETGAAAGDWLHGAHVEDFPGWTGGGDWVEVTTSQSLRIFSGCFPDPASQLVWGPGVLGPDLLFACNKVSKIGIKISCPLFLRMIPNKIKFK